MRSKHPMAGKPWKTTAGVSTPHRCAQHDKLLFFRFRDSLH